ncbi:hypothetical protein [Entomospira culicis]|uniref:Uncharacterized protein n=1 Tax=Entomospira culicis TaxID=2719989 RepID=A0A968GGL9_9SPIO|nr:hypothetical protein [Entomospira culicis]NIZ19915.1 hypothetical protein [Entomospira culicis]NIZ70128.1 hypothetical protein [Entomospira culicis]WDI38055.1 hypothetical protein PVA46_07905 [Entomospira culicis]WDI39678.1 hypothetical protein PVA47_07905 [Entomospira culicis]
MKREFFRRLKGFLVNLKKLPHRVKAIQEELASIQQHEASLGYRLDSLEQHGASLGYRLDSIQQHANALDQSIVGVAGDQHAMLRSLSKLHYQLFLNQVAAITSPKPKIVFIAQYGHSGGLQEFLYKRILFFSKDFHIILLSPVHYSESTKLFNMQELSMLFFTEESIDAVLIKTVLTHDIRWIEVHDAQNMPAINISLLKSLAPQSQISVFLHSGLAFLALIERLKTQAVDRIYVYSQSVYNDLLGHVACPIVQYRHPYVVENIYQTPKEGENNILLVSRIAQDKEASLFNLLDALSQSSCTIYISGHIVGDEPQAIVQKIKARYPNHEIRFIGYIVVEDYLKANIGKFLCIAGVGQVIGEALSFGYPALMTSIKPDNQVLFITQENWRSFWDRNFVLRDYPEFVENVNHYLAKLIQRQPLDDLQIFEQWKEHASIAKMYGDHLKTVREYYH